MSDEIETLADLTDFEDVEEEAWTEEMLTEEEECLERLWNASQDIQLQGTQFDRDAVYSFWYLSRHYDSVEEYLTETKEHFTAALKENAEAVWQDVYPMILLRATRAKVMQNPELLLSLLHSEFQLRESRDGVTDRVLMVLRKEIRSLSGGLGITEEGDAEVLLEWAMDLAAAATMRHATIRNAFEDEVSRSAAALAERKLSEIAQLPDGGDLVEPFATVMANLRPEMVENAVAFVEKAPKLKDVAALIRRKKGMPVPESLEMLNELAEAAEYGRI